MGDKYKAWASKARPAGVYVGYKYEVWAWIQLPEEEGAGYAYETAYYGDSLIKAIKAMFVAKKTSGCVKLEWR